MLLLAAPVVTANVPRNMQIDLPNNSFENTLRKPQSCSPQNTKQNKKRPNRTKNPKKIDED